MVSSDRRRLIRFHGRRRTPVADGFDLISAGSAPFERAGSEDSMMSATADAIEYALFYSKTLTDQRASLGDFDGSAFFMLLARACSGRPLTSDKAT